MMFIASIGLIIFFIRLNKYSDTDIFFFIIWINSISFEIRNNSNLSGDSWVCGLNYLINFSNIPWL